MGIAATVGAHRPEIGPWLVSPPRAPPAFHTPHVRQSQKHDDEEYGSSHTPPNDMKLSGEATDDESDDELPSLDFTRKQDPEGELPPAALSPPGGPVSENYRLSTTGPSVARTSPPRSTIVA